MASPAQAETIINAAMTLQKITLFVTPPSLRRRMIAGGVNRNKTKNIATAAIMANIAENK